MKFAIFENNRIEATKGAKGFCPSCGSELIAKCGDIRINYWSHKGKRNCDPWWENETEWHRSWKNFFPSDWQEIPLQDEQTGEIHIADIRTNNGLIIEFQHSHIDSQERDSREKFYKNMIWIVDGTRLKRDYPRFLKGKSDFRRTNKQGYYIVLFPDECFPAAWLGSKVPVIFDYQGMELIKDSRDLRNNLYCLFPKQNESERILVILSREPFIKNAINGELIKKQQEPIRQNAKPTIKRNIIKERESTHYYDPHKGRFVKRMRF
jgi:competence CoiA-like predicted nuclease